MESEQALALEMRGVKKRYRLGEIGGKTLQGDLKAWYRRVLSRTRGEVPETAPGQNPWFYALDGIDLTVRRGEALGIIGRNGAGKSTLLKLLSRITDPTEGEIDLYGRVASMLEVGTGFHGELTGRENVYLNGAILGMSRSEVRAKMDDIIGFSEIGDFIDTPVKRYSSGMYVKLGFSVAAHLDSEIMIMDEVLAVGDMAFQHKCLDRMRAAADVEGRTVLYVSHNMNTIRRLCDRCIVLDKGRIIYDGDVDKAVAVYLGADDVTRTRYTYTAEYRPYDGVLRRNRRLEMEWLELSGKDTPEYTRGEKPEFRLCCTAFQELARVGFRLELWSQDGTKIGTMLSGNFQDLKAGQNLVALRPDLSHLAPGDYRADLVAYLFDDDGSEDILDGVYPGVAFSVRTDPAAGDYLDWHHNYWGHVRLHDMETELLEREAVQ